MASHDNDIVLTCMKSDGDSMTVDMYCRMNYGLSWEEVQEGDFPEWAAEVEDLIASGELFDGEDGSYTLAIPEE